MPTGEHCLGEPLLRVHLLTFKVAGGEEVTGCGAWVNEGDAFALCVSESFDTAVGTNGEHRVIGQAATAAGLKHYFCGIAVFGNHIGEGWEGSDIDLPGCHRFNKAGVFRGCGCFHRNT